MKILQICPKIPYPPLDGGRIAMNNLTDGLIEAGCDLEVLAMSTPKHLGKVESLPSDYIKKSKIEIEYVDTSVTVIGVMLNLFTRESYNVKRFYSGKFEKKLTEILKNNTFDIIQLESLFVTPYIPVIRTNCNAKIVLRTHNIEHKIWEGLAAQFKNPLRKWYLKLLAKRLKKYEIKQFNLCDAIATITPEDAKDVKDLECKKPITVVPFGIETKKYYSANKDVELNSIFHLGSMDWKPNEEGVKWFLDKVWPRLHQKYPELKFYLAGRNMPASILNSNQRNIIVSEEVINPVDFMASKNIMIVPLLSGGGMRVKIIEGMTMGKTVVSTSVGAEGIKYKNNQNILIADSPADFVHAIDKCLSDPVLCKIIGENSRNLIKQHYVNSQICAELAKFYKQLLSN